MWLTSGEHHRPHCSQVRIYTRYDITLPLVAATSARDNSNWPLAGRLVAMPERTLKDMTYIEGVPVFGRCSLCGRPFQVLADTTTDAEQATREFYAAFTSHECEDTAGSRNNTGH